MTRWLMTLMGAALQAWSRWAWLVVLLMGLGLIVGGAVATLRWAAGG